MCVEEINISFYTPSLKNSIDTLNMNLLLVSNYFTDKKNTVDLKIIKYQFFTFAKHEALHYLRV